MGSLEWATCSHQLAISWGQHEACLWNRSGWNDQPLYLYLGQAASYCLVQVCIGCRVKPLKRVCTEIYQVRLKIQCNEWITPLHRIVNPP